MESTTYREKSAASSARSVAARHRTWTFFTRVRRVAWRKRSRANFKSADECEAALRPDRRIRGGRYHSEGRGRLFLRRKHRPRHRVSEGNLLRRTRCRQVGLSVAGLVVHGSSLRTVRFRAAHKQPYLDRRPEGIRKQHSCGGIRWTTCAGSARPRTVFHVHPSLFS